jgi:hypothetical protein
MIRTGKKAVRIVMHHDIETRGSKEDALPNLQSRFDALPNCSRV